MLTSRGSALILVVIAILAAALLLPPIPGVRTEGRQTGMVLLGLTVGMWIIWEWVLFTIRARIVLGRLKVKRDLRDEHGPVASLWAGRSFFVDVDVHLPEGLTLPHLILVDRLPFGVEKVASNERWQGSLDAGQTARWTYRLHCRTPGRVRFEGISVQLTDLCGFFYQVMFLRARAEYRVLPPLTDVRGKSARLKRHNLLPPPGLHRFRRPGSGSELLDLRDYRPGDPPKTIAWKISARRDRLISKDFESEVPVRCTLFVDTSNSVRVGPPGENTLARLVEIGTNVAQANAGARDLTGLCLFDEKSLTPIRPARGGRHLALLLNRLTDVAGLAPSTGQAPAATLLPLAYSFAREVYPELLRPEINRFPAWLPWIFPRPIYSRARPRFADYVEAGQPFYWLAMLAAMAYALFLGVTSQAQVGLFVLLGSLMVVFISLILLGRLFGGHQHVRWRKRMSAILSIQYDLAPGGLAVLMEDDERFSLYLQRFLADHHVPYSLPLYDDSGRYLFAAPQKVEVLARGLLRAVGKGRDNELFVILADLLELSDELEPLLRSVKVALARHHQVMVICPWPAGVAWRGREEEGKVERFEDGGSRIEDRSSPAASGRASTFDPRSSIINPRPVPRSRRLTDSRPRPSAFLQKLTSERFHRAFRRLQRSFARLGVPVICARDSEAARLIIERMNRLRPLGMK
jgi:uncharacterized protein (DUF58 family)